MHIWSLSIYVHVPDVPKLLAFNNSCRSNYVLKIDIKNKTLDLLICALMVYRQ